jgi:hypothetical protein|tara:strand:+ start:2581 stop:2847 length:267 start_codon:yes stop_codon:yes gene_type:complete
MTTNVPVPFFGSPPTTYSQNYFSQMTRSFALFAEQITNAGQTRATSVTAVTITLTGLSVYANNAAAVTGGLAVDAVYKTATGELRIVV